MACGIAGPRRGTVRVVRYLAAGFFACIWLAPAVSQAQVQVRVGQPGRATYSELHEGLKVGTPAADSVRKIMRIKAPGRLWRMMLSAAAGSGSWNSGLVAIT